MFCPPVSEGGQLQTTVRSKNGCMQSWQGTETTILLAAFESKHRKWSYIFTEDISNDRLALHSRPPNPHWLDQLGVGDDQVLPVDEEDWDFLFAQQIGCSDWPNENLEGGRGLEIQALKTFTISVIVRSLSRECDCWLNHCYWDHLEKTKIEKTQKAFGRSFSIFDFCLSSSMRVRGHQ